MPELEGGRFAGRAVAPGEAVQVELKISERATHQPLRIPVTVVRGLEQGPTICVTSAIHGDEINGVAIVRRLLDGIEKTLQRGTLIAVPIVNRFGFDAADRYLPDRRDLNRHFPGDRRGNMAARVADQIFRKIVLKADYAIDLHTAAEGNTNLCHIRGDATDVAVKRLMRAFGTPIMVHGEGPKGSLRRAATEAKVPSILFEAGEPGRFQRHVVEVGHLGLIRMMRSLGMLDGQSSRPAFQTMVRYTTWVRSDHGGLLDLDVEPGDLVQRGEGIGTIYDPLGRHVDQVEATASGVVLGTCTSPLAYPGMALVHIGKLARTFAKAQAHVDAGGDLGHLT